MDIQTKPTLDHFFSERVVEREAGNCRLFTLKTPVRSVVSFRGSFRSFPAFEQGEDLLQDLAVVMLDKGTRSRDRFAIADVLESRGAQLHFYGDGLRIGFSGRALQQDMPEVLGVLAEQLKEPLLDEEEFVKAQAQLAASLHRSLENTGSQAAAALAQRLYGPAHPNHRARPEEDLKRLAEITVEQVRAYHAAHFGANDLILSMAGDLDEEGMEEAVRDALGAWRLHESLPEFDRAGSPAEPGFSLVPLPDKQNLDVRMGHGLPLQRDSEDYLTLYVSDFVLGGNFSSRLMSVIRDEMGLTYGIRSGLSGITTEHEGHWQISVTLSGEKLEEGLHAVRAEFERFVEAGISQEELGVAQTTITGSFKVNLATTGGLAAAVLNNAERGFHLSYLDQFPYEIDKVTLAQANEGIRRYLHPQQLQYALAGTIPEAFKPLL